MSRQKRSYRALVYLASLLLISFAAASFARAAENVTTTVTAVGKKNAAPPPIKKDDVQVYQGKERIQVADWQHGTTLFLAILIDDSLDESFGSQISDLKNFINQQPPTTYVAVAYAQNGAAVIAQDFTTNHELAAKSIRLPLGNFGQAFTSPYLTLQDWMKRWPENSGPRRSIIMISSGIDYFRGGFDPLDPDLDSTIERAQKENINIWTIYYPSGGHFSQNYFLVFNAQANISRLSQETGAETYYLYSDTPVTLTPYYDEINQHLANQYLLTFVGGGGKKGKFDRLRVTSEVPRVEFITPSEVFLPPGQ